MDLEEFQDDTNTILPDETKISPSSPRDFLKAIDHNFYGPASRRARWMDIIGDYGGKELFVVEGESLLQNVLDTPGLALGRLRDPESGRVDNSIQILHAKFLLEQALREFLSREAQIHIVFFTNTKHHTITTGETPFVTYSRALARKLLFQHLTRLSIPLYVFEGPSDQSWTSYVSSNRPMFVLLNDGGQPRPSHSKVQIMRIIVQRLILHQLYQQGMSFALLRGAEYRDSRISTFIYDSHFRAQGSSSRIQLVVDVLDMELGCTAPLILGPTSQTSNENGHAQPTVFPLPISIQDDWGNVFHQIFLAHMQLLPSIPLAYRARKLVAHLNSDLEKLLRTKILPEIFRALASSSTQTQEVDGRIFLDLLAFVLQEGTMENLPIDASVQAPTDQIAALAQRYPFESDDHDRAPPAPPVLAPLLPFSNDDFDALRSITYHEQREQEDSPSLSSLRTPVFGLNTIIQDIRHWHSRASILPAYLGGQQRRPARTPWEQARWERKIQRDQARLQKQAASLTGAAGAILEKITVVTSSGKAVSPKKLKSTGADKARKKILDEKAASNLVEARGWWTTKLKTIKEKEPGDQIKEVLTWLRPSGRSGLLSVSFPPLAIQLRIYYIHLLLKKWSSMQDDESISECRNNMVVTLLRTLSELYTISSNTNTGVDEKSLTFLNAVFSVLGLHNISNSLLPSLEPSGNVAPSFPLAFKPIRLIRKDQSLYPLMRIPENPINWQLLNYGEFMDRSMDGRPDELKRVSFQPDGWQRKVLDAIDRNKSILVVAPTSAGKTFISFYAMEKVLRKSDTGVLVYVAPTKALVNQIAAEVYGRFSKSYAGSETLLAIQTRDVRMGDIQRAQIVVTVPEVLGILMLSPTLAKNWTPRVERIILDEIHSIGQEDGIVWEQIILLAPCPVIGLSATVGSPERFDDWLHLVQTSHNFSYESIYHPHRYSHLRKFLYLPPTTKYTFTGLSRHQCTDGLIFLHPISLISESTRSLPPDLALEARDCLSLYHVLKTKGFLDDDQTLEPATFFSELQAGTKLLQQREVLEYEARLKAVLVDKVLPYPDSIKEISSAFQSSRLVEDAAATIPWNPDTFLNKFIILVADLHVQDKLPGIFFNFDRSYCATIAQWMTENLEVAEEKWKKESSEWKSKLKKVEEWRRLEPLRRKQREKEARQKPDQDGRIPEPTSTSWEASFDENAPLADFSFAGRPPSRQELDETFRLLSLPHARTPSWAMQALKRGIAVHHAGMPKMYRTSIETLFRQGYVRVMISTGTLALGINAPARTSVFCGDSPYLTALMYRQCAGRAGRRGFDLLGNVIFYGIPYPRVQRLVLSRLPALGDSFPVTTTLILRLFNLLAGSQRAPFAVNSVQNILKLSRTSHHSEMQREQLLHHVRFSIEYLRYSGLLNEHGEPANLFALASHLYYTEPSNFALVHLFEDGIIHDICNTSEDAEHELLLVLCHLFGRKYITRPGLVEQNNHRYPSIIVLPPLPAKAGRALQQHDAKICTIFSSCARAYVMNDKETLGVDHTLPISGKYQSAVAPHQVPDSTNTTNGFLDYLKTTSFEPVTRSIFTASSGLDDNFSSVSELCSTVRSGVHLHKHSIPSMEDIVAYSHRSDPPNNNHPTPPDHELNAYIYDFYRHGQLKALREANGIRSGDVWFLLQDFELILKTIRSSLQEILVAVSKARGVQVARNNDDSDDDDDDSEVMEGEGDEEEDEVSDEEAEADGFIRPLYTKDEDWKVYEVVSLILANFTEKYHKIFA